MSTEHPVLLIRARSTDEFDDSGLRYGSVAWTPELRDKILELQALVNEHGLSEARIPFAIHWGPDPAEENLRLRSDELVMCSDVFWFQARPKWWDEGHIETAAQLIGDVVQLELAPGGIHTMGFYDDSDCEEALAAYNEDGERDG
jgi:hypothetical protein